jgi:hypothetical protein
MPGETGPEGGAQQHGEEREESVEEPESHEGEVAVRVKRCESTAGPSVGSRTSS